MRIAMGADHGGFHLKNELMAWLKHKGHEVTDMGAYILDHEDDYPDFARPVAEAVADGKAERGIIVCGSGVGANVVANKVPGVRAGLCHDTYSARQGVEHDDINVLCLGARVIDIELAKELASGFLNARFSGEARHRRRLEKMLLIEQEGVKTQSPEPPKN